MSPIIGTAYTLAWLFIVLLSARELRSNERRRG
jgi:hypothetical protein